MFRLLLSIASQSSGVGSNPTLVNPSVRALRPVFYTSCLFTERFVFAAAADEGDGELLGRIDGFARQDGRARVQETSTW